MQVDPIKPKLKPPGTKRLKLEYDGLLSNFGFKFNLRRYNLAQAQMRSPNAGGIGGGGLCMVRRCRLTLSNPR